MWQSHQFLKHMTKPQLKVSTFIYILISVFERNRINQHKFKFVDLVIGIF